MLAKLILLRNSRRSAVAMIFGLSLVPLMYLIGFAVDYTFYSQAKSQMVLAAEASATHAVRVAVSTYTLELNAGVSATGPNNTIIAGTAVYDANQAGEQAGAQWFNAQLGTLPRGSISVITAGGNTKAQPTVSVTQPSSGAGFTATVTFGGVYPPLFNGLFARTSTWTYPGNSQATATFDYAEVIMMLDTSNSMLIATNPSDILTMEQNTVCQGTTVWDPVTNTDTGRDPMYAYTYLAADGDQVDFTKVQNYVETAAKTAANQYGVDDRSGSCAANYWWPSTSSAPWAPCAFACHTSQNTATDGYYLDNYGLARRLRAEQLYGSGNKTWADNGTSKFSGQTFASSPYGTNPALTLRLDIVMDSAYNAINDMEADQGFTGQFTAGVYNFSNDVSAIAKGVASGNNATPTVEATSLTAAAAAVKADDYLQTPSETALPIYYNSGYRNTDFPTSMKHLRDGTVTGTAIAQVINTPNANPPVTPGSIPSNPLKILFIVTDGMSDPGSTSFLGEMTGYNAETTGNSSNGYTGSGHQQAVCQQFKDLGFTIYVLQIQYYPLTSTNYYGNINGASIYSADDYPSVFSTSANIGPRVQAYNTSTRTATSPPGSATYSPIQIGLRACASTTSDFYTATTSADIANAINSMLSAALASTVRISG